MGAVEPPPCSDATLGDLFGLSAQGFASRVDAETKVEVTSCVCLCVCVCVCVCDARACVCDGNLHAAAAGDGASRVSLHGRGQATRRHSPVPRARLHARSSVVMVTMLRASVDGNGDFRINMTRVDTIMNVLKIINEQFLILSTQCHCVRVNCCHHLLAYS